LPSDSIDTFRQNFLKRFRQLSRLVLFYGLVCGIIGSILVIIIDEITNAQGRIAMYYMSFLIISTFIILVFMFSWFILKYREFKKFGGY